MGPLQKKWLEALRSGKYQQGREHLRHKDNYCCLGVACKLFDAKEHSDLEGYYMYSDDRDDEGDRYTQVAPPEIVAQLKLFNSSGSRRDRFEEVGQPALYNRALTDLNDEGYSFEQIADIIEADPSMYFRESA